MIDPELRAALMRIRQECTWMLLHVDKALTETDAPWWAALKPGDVVQATDPGGCLVYLADRLTLWPANKPAVRSKWPMPLTAAPLPDPPQEGAGAWLAVNKAPELWVRSEAVARVG